MYILLNSYKYAFELHMWCAQLIFYHEVYVLLLSRLSNDIKENAGAQPIG